MYCSKCKAKGKQITMDSYTKIKCYVCHECKYIIKWQERNGADENETK